MLLHFSYKNNNTKIHFSYKITSVKIHFSIFKKIGVRKYLSK